LSPRPALVSEHYHALLRCLQASDDGIGGEVPRAIGVTSCHAGEGVTTVATNMALAAASAGRGPVLLVDANSRKPRIHRLFRLPPTDGFSDAVTGRAGVFDCVVPSPIQHLSLLLAGNAWKAQTPACDPGAVEEVLDSVKHVFPLTIVDLPPATEMTSCFTIAGKLDGIVLVISQDRVDPATALRTKSRLQQVRARLLGVVYNRRR
jgi:capsular exopolysaccharide synthesis family protein